MDNDGLEGWEGEKVERGTDGKKWESSDEYNGDISKDHANIVN